jgi:hypothetical protein
MASVFLSDLHTCAESIRDCLIIDECLPQLTKNSALTRRYARK